ncbi:MAG: hypothetical protein KF678_10875 [Phycisphaeraceae bacterium]|nr:hypothetical protein [Phycisphaeraceae bacterium]
MNHDEHQTDLEPSLSPRDAAAIEALINAGFDASRIPASAERKRVGRISSLLNLLRSGPGPDPALIDVTMARVNRAAGLPADETPLCPDDQETLDALVMAAFDPSRLPSSLRARGVKQEAVLSLLTAATAPASGSLADRTLARVQAHIDAEQGAYSLAGVRRARGAGVRLRDLLSVAAVILIGSAVLLPVMSSMREQSRRALCRTNLGSTALAMSNYASANRDSLPVATASLVPGGTWWQVGKEPQQSNSANLFTLTRAGYVPIAALACPGNPAAPTANVSPGAFDWRRIEEVSYSYQIMFGAQRPVWRRGPEAVVLADRSPVVLRAFHGEPVDPFTNAPNHACQGQHTLRNDGSVGWLASPVLPNGDNIWLPRGIEVQIQKFMEKRGLAPLNGNEVPASADDTFLGP